VDKYFFISQLGFVSRDMYDILGNKNARCFYCQGSMGSVVPFSLGLSLSHKRNIAAIEGDGSILMNLGALATVARYNRKDFRILILNNKLYESTGGQSAHGAALDLVGVAKGCGLNAVRVGSEDELRIALTAVIAHPQVIIVDTQTEASAARVPLSLLEIKDNFVEEING
jgi:sulfopyruvate decarboxylase subunit beta